MQVQVSGKQVAVGDALKTRITDELNSSIGRYFERGAINAEAVVSKDGHGFRVECVVRLASGQQLDSHGSGGDAHAAFDTSLAKLETRVRRYKRRLKNHHHPARDEAETAAMLVLRSPDGGSCEAIPDSDMSFQLSGSSSSSGERSTSMAAVSASSRAGW